jgi:hypothetical protein
VSSFGWWSAMAGPGKFMCQLCFESHPIERAWLDEAGDRWDVCQPCRGFELEAIRRRGKSPAPSAPAHETDERGET